MTVREAEKVAGVLAGLTALNALGGAVYGLRGAPGVPREWLDGSPFSDYRVPSAVLGSAIGGSCTVAAIAASRGSAEAPLATVAAGGLLVVWVAAQVRVIGLRSPLQPLMVAVGAALIALGRRMQ